MTKRKPSYSSSRRKKKKSKTTLPTRSWDESYKLLVAFHKKHGHLKVPFQSKDRGLVCWVFRQRYRPDQLTKAQQKKLQEIGMDLSQNNSHWQDPINPQWVDSFLSLIEYREEYGHFSPPSCYQHTGGYYLGKWVAKQRNRARRGLLDEQRMELLEGEIGFTWEREDVRSWDENYKALVQYHSQFGTAMVPLDYMEDPALAYWVYHQKVNHTELTKEQRKKLEELDFCFELAAKTGERKVDETVECRPKKKARNDNGNAKPTTTNMARRSSARPTPARRPSTVSQEEVPDSPASSEDRDTTTRRSSSSQSTAHSDDEEQQWDTPEDTASRISDHTPPDAQWSSPDTPVRRRFPIYKTTVRVQKRKPPTSEDRKWILMYEKLVRYMLVHGHTDCENDQDESSLSEWSQTQRRLMRRRKLKVVRRNLLDQIGFRWVRLVKQQQQPEELILPTDWNETYLTI